MKHSLRLTVLLATLLVVASCGDDDAGTTTSAGETTVPTTAAETTTTVPADTRPLAGLATMRVEDPLFGSGFHAMILPDTYNGTIAFSSEPLVGEIADTNLLGLGTMDPYPVMSGVTADMLVVVAWVENPSEDVLPNPGAVVLYGPSDQGWEALATITDTIVLDYLKTTTDYAAWEPDEGIPYARTTVKSLDWTGSAHFVADVDVLVYPDHTTEFNAEIECTLAATLDCVLLSDDGVLRPGDEGEAVQQLESKLLSIGYFPGAPDAVYDAETSTAVRVFQRDYRLGIDGKVGPQTAGLLDDIVAGTSNIVMAYQEGVGSVPFGTLVETALPALIAELGPPDYTLGWEMGPCGPTPPYGGWEWYKVTWGGFTAWFTEHDGPRQFDGWEVTDLSDVPSNLYFVGGIAPGWNLGQVKSLGGSYDEFYGWWYLGSLEYRQGTLVAPYANPPANSAKLLGWGVGTAGVLYDC